MGKWSGNHDAKKSGISYRAFFKGPSGGQQERRFAQQQRRLKFLAAEEIRERERRAAAEKGVVRSGTIRAWRSDSD
jgi:hypothetical protein